jgi:hypothetical protein
MFGLSNNGPRCFDCRTYLISFCVFFTWLCVPLVSGRLVDLNPGTTTAGRSAVDKLWQFGSRQVGRWSSQILP